MDEGTVICNKSAEAEYVSLVSSSQFSSQLYVPPSFSFSSSNLLDPSQTSAYPQRWCQYSGDVFAICNPCTPSFETPVSIPQNSTYFKQTHGVFCFSNLWFYFRRCSRNTSSHILFLSHSLPLLCRERGACLFASNLVTTTQKCVHAYFCLTTCSLFDISRSLLTQIFLWVAEVMWLWHVSNIGTTGIMKLTNLHSTQKCCTRFNETDKHSLHMMWTHPLTAVEQFEEL